MKRAKTLETRIKKCAWHYFFISKRIMDAVYNNSFGIVYVGYKYAECAFVSIYDVDMNPIVKSRALVNNLLIRTDRRLLPKDLRFINLNGETYVPELNNISEEFAFVYGD